MESHSQKIQVIEYIFQTHSKIFSINCMIILKIDFHESVQRQKVWQ